HTCPVTVANAHGSFMVSNLDRADVVYSSSRHDALPISGDFNRDGRTDIALIGDPYWHTVPVAFSNGDGSFTVTNLDSGDFAYWTTGTNTTVLTALFNRDGRTDIAINGDPDSLTVPVAFS